MNLDLGCGKAKIEGAIGVDNISLSGVDLIYDLAEFPYPLASACIDEVYLNHVIEHFSITDVVKILSEVNRLLKPGGIVHIHVPHVFSVAAWTDPTHKTAFTFGSGKFFDGRSPKAYYQEIDSCWNMGRITASKVTWFNWKRYRMRKIDNFLSSVIALWINWLLKKPTLPGSADLVVKLLPLFFVEIEWKLSKPTQL